MIWITDSEGSFKPSRAIEFFEIQQIEIRWSDPDEGFIEGPLGLGQFVEDCGGRLVLAVNGPAVVRVTMTQNVSNPEKAAMKTAVATTALIATLLASCTTLAPGAKEIIVTRNPADVAHCSPLGSVAAVAEVPGDDIRDLRNQAVGAGADTILITSPIVFNSGTSGLAYRCKQDQSADSSSAIGR